MSKLGKMLLRALKEALNYARLRKKPGKKAAIKATGVRITRRRKK